MYVSFAKPHTQRTILYRNLFQFVHVFTCRLRFALVRCIALDSLIEYYFSSLIAMSLNTGGGGWYVLENIIA